MTTLVRWCVKHKKGWCAIKGPRPKETATNVPTKCGEFVILPHGTERRVPTCKKCLAAVEIVAETPFQKAKKPTRRKAKK